MLPLSTVLLIILPAVMAGICQAFVIARNPWPSWAVPLDGGRLLWGQPIFGRSKTWRGVIVMVAATALSALLVFPLVGAALNEFPTQVTDMYAALLFGVTIGFGYSLGELPNSFLKRRLGIKSSNRPKGAWQAFFWLFDQADSVIMVALLFLLFYSITPVMALEFIVVGTLVHIVFDWFMYFFKVKR